ncbi:RAD3-like DEAD/DEAH box helicase [Hydrogenispora ethanolica]|uniref:RAD3-like DEAD/DEAH box helicase n=1 Tax=Hydrogenispora ethanolica TaxID=1082276 RepID=A0A4V2QD95_HYDET|nr:DEAD/DEAH box helicase [Hydrogenispora ethanolica]TCL62777.1 RAD3-like DEAD/DEAH box helicase [Hydrogenispora ethanolica]
MKVPEYYRDLKLDDFQQEAIHQLLEGNSVLVSAPTGVGKTLIADYLIDQAIAKGDRVIYTAPIKALSNQKFKEFKALYGAEKVGIVTGDVVINSEAEICLMTTEIFRNILHQDLPRLEGISHIIFDEIHYLSDEDRGTVWEESIIFMPKEMRLLGLSATIPNVYELAGWIHEIKGHPVTVVVKQERAVPLEHYVFEKHLNATDLKSVVRYRQELQEKDYVSLNDRREWETTHLDLLKFVTKKQQLPCLYFVFSRRMCEVKAQELSFTRSFLNEEEAGRAEAVFDKMVADFGVSNLKTVLQARNLLVRGIGYHHSGLLPALKEIVETLFGMGLIKVMYATETFAVGINYPVRTVCFDSPSKFDGVSFRPMTNLEYFQMAGRAGRRGIDRLGTVYILADLRNLRPEEFPSTRQDEIEELKSQFNLSYNSVINLNRNHASDEIQVILNQNFATYQARNDKKRFEQQLANDTQRLSHLSADLCTDRENPCCPLIYMKLRQKLKKKQRRLRFIKGRARTAIAAEIDEIKQYLEGVASKDCDKECQGRCEELLRDWSELHQRVASLQERAGQIVVSGRFNESLQLKTEILEDLDYLKEGQLLPRGEFAAQIYTQELLITELYFSGLFHELDADQLNALLVGIDYEPRKGEFYPKQLPFDVRPVKTIIRNLIYRYGVDERDAVFHPSLSNLAFRWSQGALFSDLIRDGGGIQEGDIVQAFRRGIDIMRQIKAACAAQDPILAAKLRDCMDRMDRDIIQVNI